MAHQGLPNRGGAWALLGRGAQALVMAQMVTKKPLSICLKPAFIMGPDRVLSFQKVGSAISVEAHS